MSRWLGTAWVGWVEGSGRCEVGTNDATGWPFWLKRANLATQGAQKFSSLHTLIPKIPASWTVFLGSGTGSSFSPCPGGRFNSQPVSLVGLRVLGALLSVAVSMLWAPYGIRS